MFGRHVQNLSTFNMSRDHDGSARARVPASVFVGIMRSPWPLMRMACRSITTGRNSGNRLATIPAVQSNMRTSDPQGVVWTTAGRLPGQCDPSSSGITSCPMDLPGHECGDGSVRCFNAFFYAVDTAIPIVDLKQGTTWYPTHTASGRALALTLACAQLPAGPFPVFVVGLARAGSRTLSARSGRHDEAGWRFDDPKREFDHASLRRPTGYPGCDPAWTTVSEMDRSTALLTTLGHPGGLKCRSAEARAARQGHCQAETTSRQPAGMTALTVHRTYVLHVCLSEVSRLSYLTD